jgi:hypothetical protein
MEQFLLDASLTAAMGRELKEYWWTYGQGGVSHMDQRAPKQE